MSPDLQRLIDEGFQLEIRANHLLAHGVPYLTASGELGFGTLVSTLELAGNRTARPQQHVAYFIGAFPHGRDGRPIEGIRHGGATELAPGLKIDHSFSNKPPEGYVDYHAKISRYAAIISAPAVSAHPELLEKGQGSIAGDLDLGPLKLVDTAATRAGIGVQSRRLAVPKVAIVGLGGTGSFVLDHLAKTPVQEIHLFDGDVLLQHNVFRGPGVATVEQIADQPLKVEHWKRAYSQMHARIVAHPVDVTDSNVQELAGFSFAFVCVDPGPAKKAIVEYLVSGKIPFVDAGIGVQEDPNTRALWAICRVTTVTAAKQEHVQSRLSYAAQDDRDAYDRNIQLGVFNSFVATQAVIRWMKYCGYLADVEGEHNLVYNSATQLLLPEDLP